MVTAAKKASASKRSQVQATPAKKATPEVEAPKATAAKAVAVQPKGPKASVEAPKVERDMTAYENAVTEYKALRKDVSELFSRISYQARRAQPDTSYAKTPEEATAKLIAAVAALREAARLFSEVAPGK